MTKYLILSLALGLTLATPALATPPTGSTWKQTFAEEFNGATADNGNWNSGLAWGATSNPANGELQTYTGTACTTKDGALSLTATKTTGGYNSCMLNSYGHFSQQYGYFEIRSKLPAGKGLWPAFWLLAAKSDFHWPPEIDIYEGLEDAPKTLYFNRHYACNGADCQDSTPYTGPDFSADYHTIGVDWESDRLDFYVDDVKRKTITGHSPAEPMYPLVNLAVGGNWPGNPDANTKFPAVMLVDWIRVYAKASTPAPAPTPTPTPTPPVVVPTCTPTITTGTASTTYTFVCK